MKERLERLQDELNFIRFHMELEPSSSIEAEIFERIVGSISLCRKGLRDLEDKSKNLNLFSE